MSTLGSVLSPPDSVYSFIAGDRCYPAINGSGRLNCQCAGKSAFQMGPGRTCSDCQTQCNNTRPTPTVSKPKCNLTSAICKSANRTATSCAVTSNCVCNCHFPNGQTSIGMIPKKQLNCTLSPQVCFANNPLAKSCGVTHYTNGSCTCNCISKTTGQRLGPTPNPSTVARESAQSQSTGGLKPGQLPCNQGGPCAEEGDVKQRIEGLPEGPVKDILRTIAHAYDDFWAWVNSWENIWGQKPGQLYNETIFGNMLQQHMAERSKTWSQKAYEQLANVCDKTCKETPDARECLKNPGPSNPVCNRALIACETCFANAPRGDVF